LGGFAGAAPPLTPEICARQALISGAVSSLACSLSRQSGEDENASRCKSGKSRCKCAMNGDGFSARSFASRAAQLSASRERARVQAM